MRAAAPRTAFIIPVFYIEDAPVRPGQHFGPCMVSVDGAEWIRARWNGDGWFDEEDGEPLAPRFWYPSEPPPPGVADAAPPS